MAVVKKDMERTVQKTISRVASQEEFQELGFIRRREWRETRRW